MKCTGRYRFRINYARELILQVEEYYLDKYTMRVKSWRDARIQDITIRNNLMDFLTTEIKEKKDGKKRCT